MTYLRRALKYFLKMTIILVVIIAALMLAGIVPKDVPHAFQHGWQSVWWIFALLVVLSAAYPFLGYQKRMIRVNGDPALAKDGIAAALKARGYVQEEEEDGVLKFHLSSPVNRAARLWEDRITLAPVLGGFQVEGLSRDLVRVVGAIEHHFRNHGND